jgi:hypothetical protein
MSRLADLSDPSVYKLKRSGRPAGRGGIGRNTTRVGHVCQEPRSTTCAARHRLPLAHYVSRPPAPACARTRGRLVDSRHTILCPGARGRPDSYQGW